MALSSAVADRLDRVFTLVREGVTRGDFPSAVLAIADRHTVLRCEAFGPVDGSYAATPDSIYLLASITKPIVATAVMQLVERGLILLHEPIAGRWPEFGVNHKERVTLWHLLTHTSGLDESFRAFPTTGQGATTAEIHAAELANAVHSFLNYEPGTRFTYCNASYRIMAGLIERLTGQSYIDYLRANVLDPLGMHDTTFTPTPSQASRVVPVFGFPEPERYDQFLRSASPAGGLFSTAADLIAFGRAFLGNGTLNGYRLLGPAAVAAMTRVHFEGTTEWSPGVVEPVAWGLGWAFDAGQELLPATAYRHGGATGTRLVVDPTNGLIIVFLTNHWGMDTRPRDRIFNAIYGALD